MQHFQALFFVFTEVGYKGSFYCNRVPGATIATDIICGFPTETAEDFDQTLALCEKNKFKAIFINQFYPRKGTPAANMPRIDTREVFHITVCIKSSGRIT